MPPIFSGNFLYLSDPNGYLTGGYVGWYIYSMPIENKGWISKNPILCKEIIKLYKQGLSRRKISVLVGRGKKSVTMFLYRKGFTSNAPPPLPPWSDKEKSLLIKNFKANLTTVQLRTSIPGRSQYSVTSMMQRLGLSRGQRNRSRKKCVVCHKTKWMCSTQEICLTCLPLPHRQSQLRFLAMKVICKGQPVCSQYKKWGCCSGKSDVRYLQIDHLDGDGNIDRGTSGRKFYYNIVRMGEKVSTRYQVLCANANWIKRTENKEFN